MDLTLGETVLSHNRRYLLILGGMSSKTQLNCVWVSLPNDNKGSRVVLLLEPEGEALAKHADSINRKCHSSTEIVASTIRLNRLDREKTGKLFHSKVFGNKPWVGEPVETDFLSSFLNNWRREFNGKWTDIIRGQEKRYDQDVFDITDGHPLAIVVLAGLLRSKEQTFEWETVLEQLKTGREDHGSNGYDKNSGLHIEMNLQQHTFARETKVSTRMSIQRIFATSFDNLPHDLKSCFLYFIAYPNNISCRVDRIVRMWKAEGFIGPQKGKTMEETGWDYVKELISRCLVDVEKRTGHGEIKRVLVHKRILGFLQSEAREACFMEVHDKNDVLAPAAVRRLSIQNDSGSYTTFNNKFPKLRSFICRAVGETQGAAEGNASNSNKKIITKHNLKFLHGSKFLRVICIHGLAIQELPNKIGEMIHLRYSCVASHNLEKLPSSIGRLHNLQTLEIRKTKVRNVDQKFWKIKALRHVLAEELVLRSTVINGPHELQTLSGVVASKEKWDERNCPSKLLSKLRLLKLKGLKASQHKKAR